MIEIRNSARSAGPRRPEEVLLHFEIGDRVVDAVHGVGTVKSITPQRLVGEKAVPYYEVVTAGPTIWVPVDAQGLPPLRRIASQATLAECRRLLSSAPTPLDRSRSIRQLQIARRLEGGLLPDRCAALRDLTAHSWSRPLGIGEEGLLRRISKAVCEEWAASDRVAARAALHEIEALLEKARLAWDPEDDE